LPNSIPVIAYDCPSLEKMLRLMKEQKPFIIKGIVNKWQAFEKWNISYINDVAGYRTVPVEVGTSYADSSCKQILMSVRDFIEKFVENESSDGPGYLAQHRLFDQIPELLQDIVVPDYFAFGEGGLDNVDMNIWIGPAGTVSPLHTDPKSNIFCQASVSGRKFLRLVPVTETEKVYPREGILSNTSQFLPNMRVH
uniref:JmjC domain-containing protein n=1 Tax=Gongylonema pulchrum TaxID=637853 RepID=A0A183E7C3_9BILA